MSIGLAFSGVFRRFMLSMGEVISPAANRSQEKGDAILPVKELRADFGIASTIDKFPLFRYIWYIIQLNYILWIVLTAAAVVAVVFLVRLFIQLRTTVAEAEKTLVEVRVLAKNLSELDLEVKARVEELGVMLGTPRKAGVGLSEATMLVTSKFLPAPAKFLPLLLPVARFVLQRMKKKKGKKHVE